jgi:hypothetical protein
LFSFSRAEVIWIRTPLSLSTQNPFEWTDSLRIAQDGLGTGFGFMLSETTSLLDGSRHNALWA